VCTDGKCSCNEHFNWCLDKCTVEDDQHCGASCVKCDGAKQCSGSACKLCPDGCALLSVPFPASGDNQVTFRATLNPPVNLTNAHTIIFRYNSATAPLAWLRFTAYNALGQMAQISHSVSLEYGWFQTNLDVSASGFDFSSTTQLEIQISNTGTNPTDFYVDRISAGDQFSLDFASSASPLQYFAASSTLPGTVSFVKE
jgi:hypothetical protein